MRVDNGVGELILEDDTSNGTPTAPRNKPKRGDTPEPPRPVALPDVPVVTRPFDPRFPSLESHPAVVESRGKMQRLHEQFRTTNAERIALENALGLKAGAHKPGAIEAKAIELIAAGKSPDEIDKLEILHKNEKRIVGAINSTIGNIMTALDQARREYQPAVQSALMPTRQEVARQWVELSIAHRAHTASILAASAAGYDIGALGHIFYEQYPMPQGYDDPNALQWTRQFIADGTLTANEAAPLHG